MSTAIYSRIMSRVDTINAAREPGARVITPRSVSLAAGMSARAVLDIGKGHAPSVDKIAALASVLRTTPEWLAFGVGGGEDRPACATLAAVGRVAAGTWREVDQCFEPVTMPVAPDPRYPAGAQYLLQVEGDSLDRLVLPGDYLLCVDLHALGREPENGEIVIVESRRDGGALVETTAKRLRRQGRLVYLDYVSDNPLHAGMSLVIDPAAASQEDQVAIRAIAVQSLRLLTRGPG